MVQRKKRITPPVTVKSTPKQLPDLPVEVWSKVIANLHRKKPRRDQGSLSWSQLHQKDLTNCLRVSKVFYEATIPHLYHTPIVTDFLSFFTTLAPRPICHPGRPNYPLPPNKSIPTTTKLSALKHVRDLHLMLGDIPLGPTYEDLLSVGGQWWIRATKTKDTLRTQLFRRQILQILVMLDNLVPVQTNYLPNLQNLITGTYFISSQNNNDWGGTPTDMVTKLMCMYMQGPEDKLCKDTYKWLQEGQKSFAEWFRTINPPNLCLHSTQTIYVGTSIVIGPPIRSHGREWKKSQPLPMLVSHNGSGTPDTHDIIIALDRRNIILHDDEFTMEDSNSNDDIPTTMKHLAMSITMLGAKSDFDPEKAFENMLKGIIETKGPSLAEKVVNTTVEIYGLYGRSKDTPREALARCKVMQKAFDTEAGAWKGKITFHPRSKAPKCLSCGES